MRAAPLIGSVFALAVVVLACSGPTSGPEPIELLPAETFTWTGGQPISFSPPPAGWERSRYQNGGAEGVDFVKAGSVGEQILVAERFFLGRRDRCAQLSEMLRDLNDYDDHAFRQAINKARMYAKEPFNYHEERTIRSVNDALDRAAAAFRADDRAVAHVELSRALEEAGTTRFTIEETVDRVLFTAKKNQVYPALVVEEPRDGEVAGESAVVVEFTFDAHGHPAVGRRIYVVRNNRLFEIGYQGLAENLPLFERLVDSITFPPGGCEH
jgi:hypothetical protein